MYRQPPDVPRFHLSSAAGVIESRWHCAARRKTPFVNSPKHFRLTAALYCCSSYCMHVHWLLLPVASRLDNLELLQSHGPRLFPLHACMLRLLRVLITSVSSPRNNALEKLVNSSCTLLQEWVGTTCALRSYESSRDIHHAHTLWIPNPWMNVTTVPCGRLKSCSSSSNRNSSVVEDGILHTCLIVWCASRCGPAASLTSFVLIRSVLKCAHHFAYSAHSSHRSRKLRPADDELRLRTLPCTQNPY